MPLCYVAHCPKNRTIDATKLNTFMTKRPLSPTLKDQLLWRELIKDVDAYRAPAPLKEEPVITKNDQYDDVDFVVKPRARPTYGRGFGIDRNTEEKFNRGKMPIDGKLDLHGMTQMEAHNAVQNFIVGSVRRQRRCLLIVTGKGRDGVGILRQAVPRWLADTELAQYILSTHTARMQHGAEGALYVLLRRNRS